MLVCYECVKPKLFWFAFLFIQPSDFTAHYPNIGQHIISPWQFSRSNVMLAQEIIICSLERTQNAHTRVWFMHLPPQQPVPPLPISSPSTAPVTLLCLTHTQQNTRTRLLFDTDPWLSGLPCPLSSLHKPQPLGVTISSAVPCFTIVCTAVTLKVPHLIFYTSLV